MNPKNDIVHSDNKEKNLYIFVQIAFTWLVLFLEFLRKGGGRLTRAFSICTVTLISLVCEGVGVSLTQWSLIAPTFN